MARVKDSEAYQLVPTYSKGKGYFDIKQNIDGSPTTLASVPIVSGERPQQVADRLTTAIQKLMAKTSHVDSVEPAGSADAAKTTGQVLSVMA
ncbi:MAG: hypothetical protein PHC64_01635 [Candidatus Gastranaerophilales bacterium]|nr:hypothetical protein [Candidatus Gastranaerophilales bacterium]